MNNIDELNDIDYTNHPTRFYSFSTTVESLKDLCALYKKPIFNELEITGILKFYNNLNIFHFHNYIKKKL